MSCIDITVPMKNGMPYFPSVPPVEITIVKQMEKGDPANLKKYCFGSHIGTHYDAPFHQLMSGKKGDEIPADYFIGKAKVFAFMSGKDIDLENVKPLDIEKGDMVLFKTPSGPYMFEDAFREEFVTITPAAAEYLAKREIHAVGIDYLSVDKYGSPQETHHEFFKVGIPIIEGLNLQNVEPGTYKMTALFLAAVDSDGGPIRAILEKY